jgi:hypothetical protein
VFRELDAGERWAVPLAPREELAQGPDSEQVLIEQGSGS